MKTRLPPAAVLLCALIPPMLFLLPSLQGYASAHPPEKIFMGFRYMPGDHYQYAAFIRQAKDTGHLIMENPFTSDPQRPSFLLLYFWILGNVARVTGAPIPAVWELFRVLGGTAYIVAFWYLAGLYFKDGRRRLLATVLFSFAGGLDWLVTVLRATVAPWARILEYPNDHFWNWSTFGSMAVPPWIWAALTMSLACRAVLGGRKAGTIAPAVLLPLTWFLHPYSGMAAYLTFGMLPFMPILVAAARLEAPDWDRAKSNLKRALPGLLSFLAVASYLLWARTDEVFRTNSEGGFRWTMHFSFWWYPLTYGALLPLAWFGIREAARDADPPSDLVLSWLAAAFFLSINPLYAGVKFQYLVFPPLAILAALGFFHLMDRHEPFRRALSSTRIQVACAMLLFLDAPVILVKEMPYTRSEADIFMPAAELEAMRWLENEPDGTVLSGIWAGNRIPWLSGKKVHVGHWFMSPEYRERKMHILALLAPEVPIADKLGILADSRARYVYVGTHEEARGAIDPALPLRGLYDKAGVRIYEVEPALTAPAGGG